MESNERRTDRAKESIFSPYINPVSDKVDRWTRDDKDEKKRQGRWKDLYKLMEKKQPEQEIRRKMQEEERQRLEQDQFPFRPQ